MTSVAVISSAVARIICLKDLLKNLPGETETLLGGLQAIKVLLEARGCKNAELERGIVQLSYDIVDAIADASSTAKDKPRKATTKLQELQDQLNRSLQDLRENKPESIAPPGSEVEAGTEQQQEHDQTYPIINPFRRYKSKLESITASPGRNPESTTAPLSSKVPPKQAPKKRSGINNPFRWNKTKAESTTASAIQVEEKKPESTATEVQAGSEEKGGTNIDLLQQPKEVQAGSEEKGATEVQAGTESDLLQQPKDVQAGSEEKGGTEIDLLQRLKKSSSTVVYIVSESGMGKSTCAKNLFDELKNDSSFNVCTWVPINYNFQIRRFLQNLLHKLAPRQELGMKDVTEIELVAQIFAALKNKTYLLVLDDVKSVDDWETIRLALPISGSTRIIITSNCEKFTPLSDVYKISSMSLESILKLLNNKESVEPVSEEVGETIFHVSGGSPLLATILGKSLQTELNTERKQKMLDELKSHHDPGIGLKVLATCYKWLAPEVKPCLLYLSQFRQGQDIEVEKLYLLLAAENLIFSPKESSTNLHSLLDHLEELARRDFVEVQENVGLRKGNNKSYRLHPKVQEFCKFQASQEEFLEIVDKEKVKVGLHTRRLAIHLSKARDKMSFPQFENQQTLKKILSLLICDVSESAEEKYDWPKEINDLKEFIHLRILKFDEVNFRVRNAPTGIDMLVLLRYLSFRGCWLEELPSSLSKLTQLETLDLVVQAECEMRIPNNILTGMIRMVHLYFPRSYRRSDEKKLQLQHMDKLEILVNFDMAVCDVEALSNFNKLRILSTMSNGDPKDLNILVDFIDARPNLLEYSSVDIRSFDCYDKARVSALEKLLRCEFIESIRIEGQIGKLPKKGNPTKRLAEIVLDGSEIEADPMEYLGRFENLQSLVLTNDAFVESAIVITAGTLFRNLRSLKLKHLKYLEKVTIEGGAMPELLTLQIYSCDSLQELSIPEELDERLKKAQGDDRGYSYLIMPLPPKFVTTK